MQFDCVPASVTLIRHMAGELLHDADCQPSPKSWTRPQQIVTTDCSSRTGRPLLFSSPDFVRDQTDKPSRNISLQDNQAKVRHLVRWNNVSLTLAEHQECSPVTE